MFLETTFCIDLLREARHGTGPATAKLARLGDTPLFVSVFVLTRDREHYTRIPGLVVEPY